MNIVFLNQHTSPVELGHFTRHYYLSKHLAKLGNKVTVIAGSKLHNLDIQMIKDKHLFIKTNDSLFDFYFVKTLDYKNSKLKRILSMFQYAINARKLIKTLGSFDVFVGSTPHPFAAFLAIKLAKKYKKKSFVEVRDLWPESIVEYGVLGKNNLLVKLLYKFEKWLYIKADGLIFTMEGGKDYIIDKNLDTQHGGPINLSKVYHVNNGVDLDSYNHNRDAFSFKDEDLDSDCFKVTYTGSIRKANNIIKIIKTAEIVQKIDKDIQFIIYGTGNSVKEISDYIANYEILNIKIKGRISKEKIPYVLSKSNLNIFTYQQNSLKKYGFSLNKMFDYFASGRPTLTDCESGYDIIKKYNAGIVVDNATPEQWAAAIIKVKNLDKNSYDELCNNSLLAASDYDYKKLALRLYKIFSEHPCESENK